jgi:hypothetical protein
LQIGGEDFCLCLRARCHPCLHPRAVLSFACAVAPLIA